MKNPLTLRFAAFFLVFISFFFIIYAHITDKQQDFFQKAFDHLKKELEQTFYLQEQTFEALQKNLPSDGPFHPSLKIHLNRYISSQHISRISFIDDQCRFFIDTKEDSATLKNCKDLLTKKSSITSDNWASLSLQSVYALSQTNKEKQVYMFIETLIDQNWFKKHFLENFDFKVRSNLFSDPVQKINFLDDLPSYLDLFSALSSWFYLDFSNKKDQIFFIIVLFMTLLILILFVDYLNFSKKSALSENFTKNFFSFDHDADHLFYGDVILKEKDWRDLVLKINHLRQDFNQNKLEKEKEAEQLKDKYQKMNLLYETLKNKNFSHPDEEKIKKAVESFNAFEKILGKLSSDRYSLSSEILCLARDLKNIMSFWQKNITALGALRFIKSISQDQIFQDGVQTNQLEIDLNQTMHLSQQLIDTSLRYALLVDNFFQAYEQTKKDVTSKEIFEESSRVLLNKEALEHLAFHN